jgi:hypothetical protein
MRRLAPVYAVIYFILVLSAEARIIKFPADYSTIQAGINASVDGDTVLVAHGTNYENVNFSGRNIILTSQFIFDREPGHIDSTIIDGSISGPVIQIHTNEDSTAAIIGFTIQHGWFWNGGGIYCDNANPKISFNIITDNISNDWEIQSGGGGIYLRNSNSYINNNIVSNNRSIGTYGAYGGGAYIEISNPVLVNNLFIYNQARNGGGLMCDGASPLVIRNSISWDNIADNSGDQLLLDDLVWPQISYSDIADTLYPGDGNVSVDPMFHDTLRFHLMSSACGDMYDSPLIDAGDPAILDNALSCSWGLGTIRSDIGAFGGVDWEPIGIDAEPDIMPRHNLLSQNYPNPFNARTTIYYSLPEQSLVTIDIFDILGRKIETLAEGMIPAGEHQVVWDASAQSSGIYFYRIKAGDKVETKRMTLMK